MNIVKVPDDLKWSTKCGFIIGGPGDDSKQRHVYVIWDGAEIVYVGCTRNHTRRLSQLRALPWWKSTMTMDVVATYKRDPRAAFAYERHLIHILEPDHNITSNPMIRIAATEVEAVFGVTLETEGAA